MKVMISQVYIFRKCQILSYEFAMMDFDLKIFVNSLPGNI